MKRITLFSVFFLLWSAAIFSQTDEYDPFEGHYTLLKTCELGVFLDDTSCNVQHFYDNNDKDSICSIFSDSLIIPKSADLKDLAVGDFDGDMLEEMIACYYDDPPGGDTGIVMMYYDYGDTCVKEGLVLEKIPFKYECSQILVENGNFDADSLDELMLGYVLDGKLLFTVFDVEPGRLDSLTSFVADTLDTALGSSGRFAFTCEDFNGDSIDEIVYVTSTSLKGERPGGRFKATCGFNVKVLEYTATGIEKRDSVALIYTNTFSSDLDNTKSLYLHGLHMVKGDFDNDGRQDVVFGFSYKADYQTDRGALWYEYRRQHFWSVLRPLRITEDLGFEGGDFYNVNEWQHARKSVDGTSKTYTKNTLSSTTLLSANLNRHGGDELLYADERSIYIIGVNDKLEMKRLTSIENFSLLEANSPQIVDVGSMYMDTAATTIRPHIVALRWSEDPKYAIDRRSMPFPQSTASIRIIEPVYTDTNDVTSLRVLQEYELLSGSSDSYLQNCMLALPDLNGGYQLGAPVKTIKNLIQPTIIINAPPTHFDILEDVVYDVNFLTSSEVNPNFYTKYVADESTVGVVNTSLNRSWGVSASATGGTDIGLYKVEATVTASYGQDFAESNTETEKIQVKTASVASTDDQIYGLKSEYHIYEYPVMVEGADMGYMLSSIPVFSANVWTESKSSELVDFVYTHEPGNIMSYPHYNDMADNPYIEANFNTFVRNTGFSISNSSQYSWTLDYLKLGTNTIDKSASFGLSVGVEVGGIGWSASVQGDYNQSKMSSHSTTIGEGFQIESNFDRLDDSFGETGYTLYPYLYWSKNGALVLDYKVDVNQNNSWWSLEYGDKPDPTFVMPWRLDPEKDHALSNESKRMLTRDIRIYPNMPEANDTIITTITLRNFSLLDMTEEIPVEFYHGDPRNGGTIISDIAGATMQYFPAINARQVQTLRFKWICPEDLYDSPWIFAVIDPDDVIDEIHEDNNMAFAMLTMTLPDYIEDGIEKEEFKQKILFGIYPNPASTMAKFSYSVEQDGFVRIDIYNQLGQKVETIVDEYLNPGQYFSSVNVRSYSAGIYFCKIRIGDQECTRKLIVVK